MPDKHAVLSASSSHRWLACPPSAILCAKEKDKPSEFAVQGTDAHTLCEHKLKTALGQRSKDPVGDLTFFDEEMADCTDMYAQYVMEQLSAAKERCSDPIVLIEQHLDFSQWVPDGFGTGDCVIVADETLTVIDFKYGVGILVDAENNPQMMCYALVWFGITWSLELYQQTVARLYRQGQSSGIVTVIHILTEGTVDEKIMKALADKDSTQSALIDAVKAEL